MARSRTALAALAATVMLGVASVSGQPTPTPTPTASPAPSAAAFEVPLTDLEGRTLRVQRACPWSTAGGRARYTLINDGKSPIRDLRVLGTELLHKERKELAPGSVAVALLRDGVAVDPKLPVDVEPGRSIVISVSVHGLTRAGSFQTVLALQSPSLAKVQRLTMFIDVSDHWALPFLVILLGVAVALLANLIVTVWRPGAEARLRMHQLTGDARALLAVVSAPKKRDELERITALLDKADVALALGDSAGAKTALDGADTALAAMHKTEAEQKAAQWELADKLRAALAVLDGRRATLAADELAKLGELHTGHAQAERLLTTGHVDDAVARLVELEAARKELADSLPPPPERQGARPATTRRQTAAGDDGAWLRVDAPIDARVAGTAITFFLHDPDARFAKADARVWNFGDDSPDVPGGERVSHRFADPGVYVISLTLREADKELDKLFVRVVVTATRAVRERKRLRRNAFWIQLLPSLLALPIAAGVGLWTQWSGKVFGTPTDYLAVFFWGLGIDSSVRGFAAVLAKLKPSGGAGG